MTMICLVCRIFLTTTGCGVSDITVGLSNGAVSLGVVGAEEDGVERLTTGLLFPASNKDGSSESFSAMLSAAAMTGCGSTIFGVTVGLSCGEGKRRKPAAMAAPVVAMPAVTGVLCAYIHNLGETFEVVGKASSFSGCNGGMAKSFSCERQ